MEHDQQVPVEFHDPLPAGALAQALPKHSGHSPIRWQQG
jgi:hypothetical protein